jgi:hypothetical protein
MFVAIIALESLQHKIGKSKIKETLMRFCDFHDRSGENGGRRTTTSSTRVFTSNVQTYDEQENVYRYSQIWPQRPPSGPITCGRC